MTIKADDIATLTMKIPAGTPEAPGYEAWLKGQVVQAVADLDDPERQEIKHEAVLDKRDFIVAKHEKP